MKYTRKDNVNSKQSTKYELTKQDSTFSTFSGNGIPKEGPSKRYYSSSNKVQPYLLNEYRALEDSYEIASRVEPCSINRDLNPKADYLKDMKDCRANQGLSPLYVHSQMKNVSFPENSSINNAMGNSALPTSTSAFREQRSTAALMQYTEYKSTRPPFLNGLRQPQENSFLSGSHDSLYKDNFNRLPHNSIVGYSDARDGESTRDRYRFGRKKSVDQQHSTSYTNCKENFNKVSNACIKGNVVVSDTDPKENREKFEMFKKTNNQKTHTDSVSGMKPRSVPNTSERSTETSLRIFNEMLPEPYGACDGWDTGTKGDDSVSCAAECSEANCIILDKHPQLLMILLVDSVFIVEHSLQGVPFEFCLNWITGVTVSPKYHYDGVVCEKYPGLSTSVGAMETSLKALDWCTYLETSYYDTSLIQKESDLVRKDVNLENSSVSGTIHLNLTYVREPNNGSETLAVASLQLSELGASDIFRRIDVELMTTAGVFAIVTVYLACQRRWVKLGYSRTEQDMEDAPPNALRFIDVNDDDQAHFLHQFVGQEVHRIQTVRPIVDEDAMLDGQPEHGRVPNEDTMLTLLKKEADYSKGNGKFLPSVEYAQEQGSMRSSFRTETGKSETNSIEEHADQDIDDEDATSFCSIPHKVSKNAAISSNGIYNNEEQQRDGTMESFHKERELYTVRDSSSSSVSSCGSSSHNRDTEFVTGQEGTEGFHCASHNAMHIQMGPSTHVFQNSVSTTYEKSSPRSSFVINSCTRSKTSLTELFSICHHLTEIPVAYSSENKCDKRNSKESTPQALLEKALSLCIGICQQVACSSEKVEAFEASEYLKILNSLAANVSRSLQLPKASSGYDANEEINDPRYVSFENNAHYQARTPVSTDISSGVYKKPLVDDTNDRESKDIPNGPRANDPRSKIVTFDKVYGRLGYSSNAVVWRRSLLENRVSPSPCRGLSNDPGGPHTGKDSRISKTEMTPAVVCTTSPETSNNCVSPENFHDNEDKNGHVEGETAAQHTDYTSTGMTTSAGTDRGTLTIHTKKVLGLGIPETNGRVTDLKKEPLSVGTETTRDASTSGGVVGEQPVFRKDIRLENELITRHQATHPSCSPRAFQTSGGDTRPRRLMRGTASTKYSSETQMSPIDIHEARDHKAAKVNLKEGYERLSRVLHCQERKACSNSRKKEMGAYKGTYPSGSCYTSSTPADIASTLDKTIEQGHSGWVDGRMTVVKDYCRESVQDAFDVQFKQTVSVPRNHKEEDSPIDESVWSRKTIVHSNSTTYSGNRDLSRRVKPSTTGRGTYEAFHSYNDEDRPQERCSQRNSSISNRDYFQAQDGSFVHGSEKKMKQEHDYVPLVFGDPQNSFCGDTGKEQMKEEYQLVNRSNGNSGESKESFYLHHRRKTNEIVPREFLKDLPMRHHIEQETRSFNSRGTNITTASCDSQGYEDDEAVDERGSVGFNVSNAFVPTNQSISSRSSEAFPLDGNRTKHMHSNNSQEGDHGKPIVSRTCSILSSDVMTSDMGACNPRSSQYPRCAPSPMKGFSKSRIPVFEFSRPFPNSTKGSPDRRIETKNDENNMRNGGQPVKPSDGPVSSIEQTHPFIAPPLPARPLPNRRHPGPSSNSVFPLQRGVSIPPALGRTCIARE